jgi:hypothetical protein
MSDEKSSSSFTATAAVGRPQGEHQVSVSGLVEGHEQPLPSIEPDTIDNLAQSTVCSLILLVGGSIRMEVGGGPMYPHHTMLDNVQIDTSSYAVVKVDMVHENSKDLKLEVPPDDMMLTTQDEVTRRIQLRRTSTVVDPLAIASASTTLSHPNTTPALIFPEACPSLSPIQEELHLSPIRKEPCLYPIREQPHRTPPRT